MWYQDRNQKGTLRNWMINLKCPFIHLTTFSSVLKINIKYERHIRQSEKSLRISLSVLMGDRAGPLMFAPLFQKMTASALIPTLLLIFFYDLALLYVV